MSVTVGGREGALRVGGWKWSDLLGRRRNRMGWTKAIRLLTRERNSRKVFCVVERKTQLARRGSTYG